MTLFRGKERKTPRQGYLLYLTLSTKVGRVVPILYTTLSTKVGRVVLNRIGALSRY